MWTAPISATVATQRLLVLVLPVFIIVVAGTVYALLPDSPPAPPLPNTGLLPDPEPLPPTGDPDKPLQPLVPAPKGQRRTGAPASLVEADAILAEVNEKLTSVRSRLELKFKVNEYQHDPAWDLQSVMRRLSTMDGTHFRAADYALGFPAPAEPVVEIACNTRQGAALPDGPIKMVVNLKTGESEIVGNLYARDQYDRIYLSAGDLDYAAETVLTRFNADFVVRTGGTDDSSYYRPWRRRSSLTDADFVVSVLSEQPLVVEYACRAGGGSELAEPVVLRFDYSTWRMTCSNVASEKWHPKLEDRDEFKDDNQWRLSHLTELAQRFGQSGKPVSERRLGEMGCSSWAVGGSGYSACDIRVSATDRKIRVSIATSMGRPLPFAQLVYERDIATGIAGYVD